MHLKRTKNKVIYPGTFDPITNGHTDLIERAAKLFDELVIAIGVNPQKKPLFDLDERIALAKAALSHLNNVEILGFSGLLTQFAQDQGATILLRGLRAVSDFEFEFQLAGMNRSLNAELETIFMPPTAKHTFISSTLVKEIALLGGDVRPFVHPAVVTAFQAKMKQR